MPDLLEMRRLVFATRRQACGHATAVPRVSRAIESRPATANGADVAVEGDDGPVKVFALSGRAV